MKLKSNLQFFGTGWRKNRDESNKPIFWDGQNEGGKVLMNIRHELKAKHSFSGPQEEEVGFVLHSRFPNDTFWEILFRKKNLFFDFFTHFYAIFFYKSILILV